MALFWPYAPRSTSFDEQFITRLILFKDYVRIDFQITDNTAIEPDRYLDGYHILIDKDNLTTCLRKPTFQHHIIQKPTKHAFETLVNEFWWAATYVPKYLWRDELPFAKYMLDNVMRYDYLQNVVEWYIGLQYDWSVNTGLHGKWFKNYLDEDTWTELKSTYTGAARDENWHAFFRFTKLFRRLTMFVANQLHYSYPMDVDKEVTEYCHQIQDKSSLLWK